MPVARSIRPPRPGVVRLRLPISPRTAGPGSRNNLIQCEARFGDNKRKQSESADLFAPHRALAKVWHRRHMSATAAAPASRSSVTQVDHVAPVIGSGRLKSPRNRE
jgi:hypothetical protein